ncbi:hypothetical protein [Chitiniphilus eburneus]|uniref:hypothetical protein n=1 Tax=Chitiniphilus eburneus TaxID=2571148 RepID=UPI0035D0738D
MLEYVLSRVVNNAEAEAIEVEALHDGQPWSFRISKEAIEDNLLTDYPDLQAANEALKANWGNFQFRLDDIARQFGMAPVLVTTELLNR